MPFDQQPLEAWAAIDACRAAYDIDGDEDVDGQVGGLEWRVHAGIAWSWYLGDNDRGVVMGDMSTGFCRDGITSQGANENRGAESLLAFQLAYLGRMAIFTARDGSHNAGTNGGQIRNGGTLHTSA
jgi:hypothetical protein